MIMFSSMTWNYPNIILSFKRSKNIWPFELTWSVPQIWFYVTWKFDYVLLYLKSYVSSSDIWRLWGIVWAVFRLALHDYWHILRSTAVHSWRFWRNQSNEVMYCTSASSSWRVICAMLSWAGRYWHLKTCRTVHAKLLSDSESNEFRNQESFHGLVSCKK